MLFDSKRECCGLRDIPGMLLVPSARSEQQDVILRFEILDESSAFCRDEAYVFLFRADHEIHAFLLKPTLFLWDEPTIIKKTSPGRVLKNSLGVLRLGSGRTEGI